MSVQRVKVIGVKFFKGEVNGSKIDSGKIYAECKFDESRNDSDRQWSKGVWAEEWRLPNSETAKRLIHIPLPFEAELDIERVGNGKESRENVIGVRPIEMSRPAAPVKAA